MLWLICVLLGVSAIGGRDRRPRPHALPSVWLWLREPKRLLYRVRLYDRAIKNRYRTWRMTPSMTTRSGTRAGTHIPETTEITEPDIMMRQALKFISS